MATDSSQDLVAAMCDPAAYPHPVRHVEMHQTHISWVFLTGELAYKVKKPVRLGFLDFSAPERRKFFCEEELRLNGRLAPHLYLRVVPIVRNRSGPPPLRVDCEGEAVEHAVQMRQFPQEALLPHVLERGELRAEHIDTLAAEVATFHRRAANAPADSRFGRAEAVIQPVEECLDQLLPATGGAADRDAIETVRQWIRDEHSRRRDLFEHRRQEGFVRECHGDMHLGNMLLEGERVTLFDGIEFNESLRWIDVISDVAFTHMDLTDRGQRRFAVRFLNAYLEHTGDYSGMGVLRFYSTYRALVRAKVAGVRLSQPDLDAREQEELERERGGYLRLAEAFTRTQKPTLIIAHGLSGSGKSTWTQPLLERLPAVRVRSDIERKRLAGLNPQDRSASAIETGLYAADRTEATYSRLLEAARQIVLAGTDAIVDATFLAEAARRRFQDLSREFDVAFAILDFQAPEGLLRARISERERAGRDPSEATLAVLESQLRSREPLTESERRQAVTIDSSQPPDETRIAQVVAEVRRVAGQLFDSPNLREGQ